MSVTSILLILILLISIILLVMQWQNANQKNTSDIPLRFTQINEQIVRLDTSIREEFSRNREEIRSSLKTFADILSKTMSDIGNLQKDQLETVALQLEKIRETVEKKLTTLQAENSKKLDEMRATVDEKLQTTLEKRLTESFKQVSERLEQVHKGLGEMQSLATGVGDLKKVLSNVKTRGILGEIQLENILDQLLSVGKKTHNFSKK
jgi:DNA recombination protein RmuC